MDKEESIAVYSYFYQDQHLDWETRDLQSNPQPFEISMLSRSILYTNSWNPIMNFFTIRSFMSTSSCPQTMPLERSLKRESAISVEPSSSTTLASMIRSLWYPYLSSPNRCSSIPINLSIRIMSCIWPQSLSITASHVKN